MGGLADLPRLIYLNFGLEADKDEDELAVLKKLCLSLQARTVPLQRLECCSCGGNEPEDVWTFCNSLDKSHSLLARGCVLTE